jgi:hypothetical protein
VAGQRFSLGTTVSATNKSDLLFAGRGFILTFVGSMTRKSPTKLSMNKKIPYKTKYEKKIPHKTKYEKKIPHETKHEKKIPHETKHEKKIPHKTGRSEVFSGYYSFRHQ